MSLERLNMMREYFEQKGWSIRTEEGSTNWKLLCKVFNEKIEWIMDHRDPKVSPLKLVFFLFGDMGQDTNDLNDILFCEVKGRDRRLYFDKINSEEWTRDLKQFVNSLAGHST